MVLKKVGEFQTTISVNGNQKISTVQSSDKSYNLTNLIEPNKFGSIVTIETPSEKFVYGGTAGQDIKNILIQEVGSVSVNVFGSATLDYEISGGGGGGGAADTAGDYNSDPGEPTTFNSETANGGEGGSNGDEFSASNGSDGNGGTGSQGGSGGSEYDHNGGNGGNGFVKTNSIQISDQEILGSVGDGGRGGHAYFYQNGQKGNVGYIDLTITI